MPDSSWTPIRSTSSIVRRTGGTRRSSRSGTARARLPVMGTSRGAAYRRFYLYSALSVAVIAISVAVAILIHLGVQTLGFGPRTAPGDASRNVSLSCALLAIRVPAVSVHLWLILLS